LVIYRENFYAKQGIFCGTEFCWHVFSYKDKRPCDQCIFMANIFHPDLCLHIARRDPGALGDALDEALHWNADCPVQRVGHLVFDTLLDLNLPVDEWETAGEYLRARIAEHIKQYGSITAEDIVQYAARYEEARAVTAELV
jgi:hypothetical protein